MFGNAVSLANSLSSPFIPANGAILHIFSAHILPGGADQLLVCRGNIPNGTIDVLSWKGGGLALLGSTSFSLPGPYWYFLDKGDFNGDGVTDLAGYSWSPQPFSALYTFFTFEGSPSPPYMTLGVTTVPALPDDTFETMLTPSYAHDVNQDGLADLVLPFRVPYSSQNPLGVGHYIAVGLGDPVAPLSSWIFTHLAEPCTVDFDLLLGDYDADGRVDALTVGLVGAINCVNGPGVYGESIFYRGDGTGSFRRALGFSQASLQNGINPLSLADSDQDGDLDFWAIDPFVGVYWAENLTITGSGFAPPGAVIPRTTVGFPTPGNSAFSLGIAGVPPQSACLLGLSTARSFGAPALPGLMLELDPAHLLLPTPGGLGFLSSGSTGAASLSLPLPQDPALAGLVLYAQGFTLPGSPQGYAASATRRIVIW